MKLYIVDNGKCFGGTSYVLIAETGEALAGHVCSSEGFAEGDLYYNRPERIEKYNKKFGEVEVLFLGDDEMTKKELIKRNKEWNKKEINNDR